jgi:hypothetical protein
MALSLVTLSDADKALIARDALRAKESDYFRFSMMDPSSYGGPERLEVLEAEIKSLQSEVKKLDKTAEKAVAAAAKATAALRAEQAGKTAPRAPSDKE